MRYGRMWELSGLAKDRYQRCRDRRLWRRLVKEAAGTGSGRQSPSSDNGGQKSDAHNNERSAAGLIKMQRVGTVWGRAGCESPASHVLARRLAELGCRVFIGVRASSHAEAGRIAGDLAGDPSRDPASGRPGPVHVLGLKPGDPRSVTAAEKEVRSLVGADGLWGLVVVAAADGRAPCGVGMLSEVPDVGAYRHGLERGLLAPMELAGVFLPLVRRACGRVVFVGPGAAVEAPAGGPQAVVAAALAAFCVALRGQLGSEGTHVCGVEVPDSSGSEWDPLRPCGRARTPQETSAGATEEATEEASPTGVAETVAALLSKRPAERYPLRGGEGLLGHAWALARRASGPA
ncbi:uncharacterized protein LOC116945738 isoform X2 [Petromyzon marinus]|uniref:uncharacterized protein LOC116945738 isoform X2 n=1 Tax=Petromyzon marinus TaxID=7757 RepID=UPI003F714930